MAIDLPNLALPAAIVAACSGALVALIKAYGPNRKSTFRQQAEHIDRLVAERKEAIDERDKMYDELEKVRRDKNIIEGRAQAATLLADKQSTKIADLTVTIQEMTAKISHLEAEIQRLTGGGTP